MVGVLGGEGSMGRWRWCRVGALTKGIDGRAAPVSREGPFLYWLEGEEGLNEHQDKLGPTKEHGEGW